MFIDVICAMCFHWMNVIRTSVRGEFAVSQIFRSFPSAGLCNYATDERLTVYGFFDVFDNMCENLDVSTCRSTKTAPHFCNLRAQYGDFVFLLWMVEFVYV